MLWFSPSCFPLITEHKALYISIWSSSASFSITNAASPLVMWLGQGFSLTVSQGTWRLRSGYCPINSISPSQQPKSSQDKWSPWSIQFTTSQSHSFIPCPECTMIKRFYSCFLETRHGVNVQSFIEQFSPTAQGCLKHFSIQGHREIKHPSLSVLSYLSPLLQGLAVWAALSSHP